MCIIFTIVINLTTQILATVLFKMKLKVFFGILKKAFIIVVNVNFNNSVLMIVHIFLPRLNVNSINLNK